MTQALNISFRPRTFDDLVGQEGLVEKIREHMKSGRVPNAWMFSGSSGVGKTTIARILALSLQCTHQKEFGHPCRDCRKNRSQFDIVEINAAEASGIDETESVVTGAFYSPKPPSKYRVYIWDEAQKLSNASQNALLKYFEDSPKTTVWIICTTEPGKIIPTLQRRCLSYVVPELDETRIRELVRKAIRFAGKNKKSKPLAHALYMANVGSPGFIAMAVEKYLAGDSAENAALVTLDSTLDVRTLAFSVLKGDWITVRNIMRKATPADARVVRAVLSGYLRNEILRDNDSIRTKAAIRGIEKLATLTMVEEGLQLSGTVAMLHKICRYF